MPVGSADGSAVGCVEGSGVGLDVGSVEGVGVGAEVGWAVDGTAEGR